MLKFCKTWTAGTSPAMTKLIAVMNYMTFPDIIPDLEAAMPDLRGRLLANQSLAELTWFRVGGPAQVLFTPSDEDDLAYFSPACQLSFRSMSSASVPI